MKVSAFSDRVTAFLVLSFMLFLMIFTFLDRKRNESFTENRDYSEMPVISSESLSDGSFGSLLESYITDHFALRDFWISSRAGIKANMCEKIVNGVYIYGDRMLDADISERNISLKNAVNVNKFAGNYRGTVYFAIVPTSSGVYGDVLPEYLLSNPEESQIDRLYDTLDNGIRKIDTYNILKMLNESYIYYRTDTRLTGYGAYCVYRTVIQKLGFLPSAYDKYTIRHMTDDFRGNLYNRCLYNGIKPDILDIYSYSGGAEITECTACADSGVIYGKTLNDTDFLESGNMYNMYLGEDVPFLKINTSLNNEKKLLVIKDSSADCFIQFFIQHYSEIAVVSPEYSDRSIDFFVDPDEYGQTLFLFGIDSMDNENLLDMINLQ